MGHEGDATRPACTRVVCSMCVWVDWWWMWCGGGDEGGNGGGVSDGGGGDGEGGDCGVEGS